MRVGFTGTQDGMTSAQATQIHMLLVDLQEPGSNVANHGMCIGSDVQFDDIAGLVGYRTVGYPGTTADGRMWKRGVCSPDLILPERPFLDRNKSIVNDSEVTLATPREFTEQVRGGTWTTIRYARKSGKPLVIVFPDGTGTIENVPGCETLEQYRHMVNRDV